MHYGFKKGVEWREKQVPLFSKGHDSLCLSRKEKARRFVIVMNLRPESCNCHGETFKGCLKWFSVLVSVEFSVNKDSNTHVYTSAFNWKCVVEDLDCYAYYTNSQLYMWVTVNVESDKVSYPLQFKLLRLQCSSLSVIQILWLLIYFTKELNFWRNRKKILHPVVDYSLTKHNEYSKVSEE